MDNLTYEIYDDGYDIFKNGVLWITQRKPLDKTYLPNGTYKENAEAHIADLIESAEAATNEQQLRADVDFMALMLDVDLPSYGMEG